PASATTASMPATRATWPCSRPTDALHSFPTRRSSDLFSANCQLRNQRTLLIFSLYLRALPPVTFYRFVKIIIDVILQRHGLREPDRKSTRLNSRHVKISYAAFCL